MTISDGLLAAEAALEMVLDTAVAAAPAKARTFRRLSSD
jgi:hypothetical protein